MLANSAIFVFEALKVKAVTNELSYIRLSAMADHANLLSIKSVRN